MAGARDPNDSGDGPGSGEAVRGGNDRTSFEGKRALDRLLDLLHARQRGRSAGADHRVSGAQATGIGNCERVSHGGAERFSNVLGDAVFLSRADKGGGGKGAERRRGAEEYLRGAAESAVRIVSNYFFRIFHDFLAAVCFGAALFAALCEPGREFRSVAFRGP